MPPSYSYMRGSRLTYEQIIVPPCSSRPRPPSQSKVEAKASVVSPSPRLSRWSSIWMLVLLLVSSLLLLSPTASQDGVRLARRVYGGQESFGVDVPRCRDHL